MFNATTLLVARESRGCTQRVLAGSTGVTQAVLSKIENGQAVPSDSIVEAIARALRYPVEFFQQDFDYRALPVTFFRKQKTLPSTQARILTARINILQRQLRTLLQSVEIPPLRVPSIDLDSSQLSIEQIARELRLHLQVPPGPIRNLIQTLEAAGILVVECTFASRRIAGLSTFNRCDAMPPVIFLNRSLPGDRQRWTCCHELAHIIFHHHLDRLPATESEEEADRFASELLLPAAEIRAQLTAPLKLESLANLKRHWGVSMQSLIRKAAALGRISDRTMGMWFARFNKLGYKLDEPVEIPKERPTLIGKIVSLHLTELQYSESDLSRALKVELPELQELYELSPPGSLKLVSGPGDQVTPIG